MIVFISDLHWKDEGVGLPPFPAQAFRGAFEDLSWHARNAGASEVVLVFLGDIFDMAWSPYWGSVPAEEAPWAGEPNPDKVVEHAQAILQSIIKHNGPCLRAIREFTSVPLPGKEGSADRNVPVRRVYVPGNHDRILDTDQRLRQIVIRELALTDEAGAPLDPKEPFPHEVRSREYGCLARHGHEWDPHNFEGADNMPAHAGGTVPLSDYHRIPFGEVLTAEIARLPDYVEDALWKAGMEEADTAPIVAQLKSVYDLRPVSAIVPWLQYHLRSAQPKPRLHEALKSAIKRFVASIADEDYVTAWAARHSHLGRSLTGILLKSSPELLEMIPAETLVDHLLPHITGGLENEDRYSQGAAAEFDGLDKDFLYVVYGHTHTPLQSAVDCLPEKRARVYLNTGTWWPLHRLAASGNGFLSWKSLTYTLLYGPHADPDAAPAGFATFETWTGSLLQPPG